MSAMAEVFQQQQEEQQEREDSECMFYYQVEQQHEMINGNPAPLKSGFKGDISWDSQQATTAAATINECQAAHLL